MDKDTEDRDLRREWRKERKRERSEERKTKEFRKLMNERESK